MTYSETIIKRFFLVWLSQNAEYLRYRLTRIDVMEFISSGS